MYKPIDKLQGSFLDFNQPMGLHMNPNNRLVKMADRIPWDEFEIKYAKLFPSNTGNVAKPLRMALGALIIQKKFQCADRELVEQIAENPYLQYFIGLPGYREEAPFDASTLVLFRKRIFAEMLMEANGYLLAHKDDGSNTPPSSGNSDDNDVSKEDTNKGTLTLDATCAPANIRYPQDISLLNEAREKLGNASGSVSVIIQNVCWQTKYTESGRTGTIAKTMESGCQSQNLEDQAPTQKLIKNRSTKIIPIESKQNVLSA